MHHVEKFRRIKKSEETAAQLFQPIFDDLVDLFNDNDHEVRDALKCVLRLVINQRRHLSRRQWESSCNHRTRREWRLEAQVEEQLQEQPRPNVEALT